MRKDTKNIYLNGHGLSCPCCGHDCGQWTVIDAECIPSAISSETPVGASGIPEAEHNQFIRWQCDGCGRKWEETLVVRAGCPIGKPVDVREVLDETAP